MELTCGDTNMSKLDPKYLGDPIFLAGNPAKQSGQPPSRYIAVDRDDTYPFINVETGERVLRSANLGLYATSAVVEDDVDVVHTMQEGDVYLDEDGRYVIIIARRSSRGPETDYPFSGVVISMGTPYRGIFGDCENMTFMYNTQPHS